MKILDEKLTTQKINKNFADEEGFIKGVVDIEKNLVAIDAEMHYMLSDYLKTEKGSSENDMWGFNLWLNETVQENILEFDSFISIRNNQAHGFLRGGMSIEDDNIKEKAKEVIENWIQF